MSAIKVFSSPDLLYIIADHLPSRAGLSALSRCSRNLHEITIPILYRDIEFSVYKVGSLAAAIRANNSLSHHCRRLSVTKKGKCPDEQALAFKRSNNLSSPDILMSRQNILHDLGYVIERCSEHGSLAHFSWNNVSEAWLTDVLQDWKCITASSKALKSLQLIFYVHKPVLKNFGPLSQHTLPILSELVLHAMIAKAETQALRRFLSSSQNIKVLDFALYYHSSYEFDSASSSTANDDALLLDVTFQQLESLKIRAVRHDSGIYAGSFISRQPSLIELSIYGNPGHRIENSSSSVKALLFQSLACDPFFSPLANALSSLTMLRIDSRLSSSPGEWTAFANGLVHLRCIEVYRRLQPKYYREKEENVLMNIRKDIVEFGILVDLFQTKPGFNQGPQKKCVSTIPLDAQLDYCSKINTLRAVRLSYSSDSYHNDLKLAVSLPDEHELREAKIPQALEYVLWEVPWTKRLYKVERGNGNTKMVYTGLSRLPGRPYRSTLTWTNESVFDHVSIGEGGNNS